MDYSSRGSSEFRSLVEASERIGNDPLLTQAATGNTSIKVGGVLWIKASGKWLADALNGQIFIPVDLAETRARIRSNVDPAGRKVIVDAAWLETSTETAMHALLPHRAVFHVHSINTIAWTVRKDGAKELHRRLAGLKWQWIPYVRSGLPLALAVQAAMTRSPETSVLVLANHGLVIGGDRCASAMDLLRKVECRLAIAPKRVREPAWRILAQYCRDGWQAPADPAVHTLGIDKASIEAVSGGILYPCEAMFLTRQPIIVQNSSPIPERASREVFLIVAGIGVLVRKELQLSAAATLSGLSQVLRRIPACTALNYLSRQDVRELLRAGSRHYRDLTEINAWCGSPRRLRSASYHRC
jgi:rhamnose utilization protein RhaD (predicted bifunctional aldolase and dehydrogenase)